MHDIVAKYKNGIRDFTGADLTGACLAGACLAGSDLTGADLTGACLAGSDLTGANLTGANLTGAYLTGANLTGANLTGSYLTRSDLTGACLARAYLAGSYLARANLTGANLARANLTGAYLTGANLTGAYLTGANLPHFQICPEVGAFVAFKKLRNDRIAELVVPADSPRTSSLVGRKCRAAWVEVTALYDLDGSPLPSNTVGIGIHDGTTKYIAGERTEADGWDDDIRIECTHGIHFFMTLREAREYA